MPENFSQPEQVITPTEAARLYRQITGRRRSPKCVEADVHTFHHLGCFDHSRPCAEPTLRGIYRRHWEYFVRMRFLIRGHRRVFSTDGEGDMG